MKFYLLISLLILASNPLHAATHNVDSLGTVNLIEGSATGSEIRDGDQIFWTFALDESELGTSTVLPIGGGSYTIYAALLTSFSIKIGTYSYGSNSVAADLTFMDDSWGQDGIVISVTGLPGGPFGSGFSNIQFQGRSTINAIGDSGIGNGLPLGRFDLSMFAFFGDGNVSKRVYGNLELASPAGIPEPSGWCMMLAGLFLTGALIRRSTKISFVQFSLKATLQPH